MQGIPQGQNNSGGGSQKPSLSWQSPNVAKPISAHEKPKPPAPPPQKNNTAHTTVGAGDKSSMGTYAGIFVAGLVVGALLGWGLSGRSTGPASPTDTQSSTTDTGDVDLTGSAVGASQGITVASGQEPGPTVSVSNVNVDKPTWVVIYDNESGAPGRVLGAQLFFPVSVGGETSGTVSLLRSTLAGHSYLAGERVDNGDHKYSQQTDNPVTDASGKQVTVQFSVK